MACGQQAVRVHAHGLLPQAMLFRFQMSDVRCQMSDVSESCRHRRQRVRRARGAASGGTGGSVPALPPVAAEMHVT